MQTSDIQDRNHRSRNVRTAHALTARIIQTTQTFRTSPIIGPMNGRTSGLITRDRRKTTPSWFEKQVWVAVTPGTSGANRGESITFKIEPGYGQQIVDVRVNGNSVGAVESYQIKNIRSNTTLEAVFSNVGVPVHTLTSKVIHDWVGYVTPSKVRVTEGSNHIFIAHPNKNRKIDDVQIGTEKKLESIGTPSSYIFTDVKADSLIVVTFHSPVANESISAPDYMIYTEDKTVVVNPENEVGAIKIYDLMGRIVCSQAIETTTRIPLTEGIYVVVLTINDKQYVKKVSL